MPKVNVAFTVLAMPFLALLALATIDPSAHAAAPSRRVAVAQVQAVIIRAERASPVAAPGSVIRLARPNGDGQLLIEFP